MRCQVRGDLFSTMLTAAFMALLWSYHETGRARLWLLPVLMVVWVNTHLGFCLGLALVAVLAWRWLPITFTATLINPYGVWVYEAVYDQMTTPQLAWIGEWQPPRLLDWHYAPLDIPLVGAILLALVSAAWRQEADRYGINSILAWTGWGSHFQLLQFCNSDAWAPVYLDRVSAIFVRRAPENEALID
jgi:hypothetical protein